MVTNARHPQQWVKTQNLLRCVLKSSALMEHSVRTANGNRLCAHCWHVSGDHWGSNLRYDGWAGPG